MRSDESVVRHAQYINHTGKDTKLIYPTSCIHAVSRDVHLGLEKIQTQSFTQDKDDDGYNGMDDHSVTECNINSMIIILT